MHLEESPNAILEQIRRSKLEQQKEFDRIWNEIRELLKRIKIFSSMICNQPGGRNSYSIISMKDPRQYHPADDRKHPELPGTSDKSIYLALQTFTEDKSVPQKFALVSVPARRLPRFTILPSRSNENTSSCSKTGPLLPAPYLLLLR